MEGMGDFGDIFERLGCSAAGADAVDRAALNPAARAAGRGRRRRRKRDRTWNMPSH